MNKESDKGLNLRVRKIFLVQKRNLFFCSQIVLLNLKNTNQKETRGPPKKSSQKSSDFSPLSSIHVQSFSRFIRSFYSRFETEFRKILNFKRNSGENIPELSIDLIPGNIFYDQNQS